MWTSIGLVVALGGPPLLVVLTSAVFGASPTLRVQIGLELLYVAMATCVIWIVVRGERRSLRSIGLRRPDRTTVLFGGLACACALYILPMATDPIARWIGANAQPGVADLAALPLWFRVVLGASGGAVEETLYRGYAIERLASRLGRPWAAGLISVVAFAVAHVPAWGWRFALAADLPFGILMTLLYLWRRDLVANALAHGAALVISMLTLTVATAG